MDACSSLKAFSRGKEDGLLSAKNMRFVWGRYMHISEGIRNRKEYEGVPCHGCYLTYVECPWLRLDRELKGYGP